MGQSTVEAPGAVRPQSPHAPAPPGPGLVGEACKVGTNNRPEALKVQGAGSRGRRRHLVAAALKAQETQDKAGTLGSGHTPSKCLHSQSCSKAST